MREPSLKMRGFFSLSLYPKLKRAGKWRYKIMWEDAIKLLRVWLTKSSPSAISAGSSEMSYISFQRMDSHRFPNSRCMCIAGDRQRVLSRMNRLLLRDELSGGYHGTEGRRCCYMPEKIPEGCLFPFPNGAIRGRGRDFSNCPFRPSGRWNCSTDRDRVRRSGRI